MSSNGLRRDSLRSFQPDDALITMLRTRAAVHASELDLSHVTLRYLTDQLGGRPASARCLRAMMRAREPS